MSTVLVTGANGFVGGPVCERLLEGGWQVKGSVRSEKQAASLPEAVDPVIVGDLSGNTDWTEALRGVATVVHLAGRAHVLKEDAENPLEKFRQVNVQGASRLAGEAAKAGVRRFVYVSSVKVHGEGGPRAYNEDDKPEPSGPYAQSKWEAEQALLQVARETGLEMVVLRPPLIYGPGVKANFLRLFKLIKCGLPLPFGSIHNKRSMIYVENLADAIAVCLEHQDAVGGTFLLRDGEDLSMQELIRLLGETIGERSCLVPFPLAALRFLGRVFGKSGTLERMTGSLTVDDRKIHSVLGWTPPVAVEKGVGETACWFRSKNL